MLFVYRARRSSLVPRTYGDVGAQGPLSEAGPGGRDRTRRRTHNQLRTVADVFDATERWRFPGPGGTVAHAEIEIGDSVIIVEDESPERGTKAPAGGWH